MPLHITFRHDQDGDSFMFQDSSIKHPTDSSKEGFGCAFTFSPRILSESTILDLPKLLRQRASEIEKIILDNFKE